MSSRKENLKKSLGITEYPWSSDDEEDVPPVQEVMSRTTREPRASVADLPGTSGAQPQPEQASPGAARRLQARMDRDLFWSIINNTSRPSNSSSMQQPRSRQGGSPMCPPPRSSAQPVRSRIDHQLIMPPEPPRPAARRTERQPASADVNRILAFKKLTRSLQNITQNKTNNGNGSQRPPNTANATPRASRPQDRGAPQRNAGVQNSVPRSTLFTPAPAAYQMNRDNGYTYNAPWRRSLPAYPDVDPRTLPGSWPPNSDGPAIYDTQQGPSDPWHYGHASSGAAPGPSADPALDAGLEPAPGPSQPSTSTNISDIMPPYPPMPNISTDGMHVPPPLIQKVEPADEPTDNPEENIEEVVRNGSGSGARLIEEVLEVDVPDAADNNPPPPGTEHEPVHEPVHEPGAQNNTSLETTTSEENGGATQEVLPPYHGVKRKREPDDSNETFSVQDFNQSLLRLLECPVCLEWMEPPISQCRRGHLVCSRCRARLAACPVCRTPFSSVRNRAMEGVAEMLRYPCRHGCGREVRLRRRGPHEASCSSRRYNCPAMNCARHPPLLHDELAHHFQCKHLPILKIGTKHKFSMKVNSEQHETWLIMALEQYFHLRVDVDIRTWGVVVYVAYIGPKKNAKNYTYEVTVEGQHNARKLVYTRATHSDLESASLNVSRQDCFHLTLDQALNFLRFKNRHCEPDKYLDFDVAVSKWEKVDESKDDSES